jgi:hypothetical protein
MNGLAGLLALLILATLLSGCAVGAVSNSDQRITQPTYATDRARDAQGGGGGGGGGGY